MRSLSPIVKQGRAIANAERTVLREEGIVEFLRTSAHMALEFLGFILLDTESMLMDAADVQKHWAQRSGEYSPQYYADFGPDRGSEAIRIILDILVESDAAVLELGCSSGRHLSHLQAHGYDDLYGIEINDEALDAMADAFPDLAETGTFYLDAIENVVPQFEDERFDVVFSVETLQHIHPDNEWVFEEIARITSDVIITVENEGTDDEVVIEFAVEDIDEFPLYYRKWKPIFTALGFEELGSKPESMDTFRVFRRV